MSTLRDKYLGNSNNVSYLRQKYGLANTTNSDDKQESLNSNSRKIKLFKKGSAFDDGYQFGDVTKTVTSTVGDLATNIGKGFLNTVEGVTDAGQYLLADAAKGLSKVKALDIWDKNARNWLKEKADALEENAKFDSTGALFGDNEEENNNLFKKGWSKKLDEKSVIDDTIDSAAQGIGNVGAMAGLSFIGGNMLGTGAKMTSALTSFSTAFGNAKSEAYKNGADDRTSLEAATISGLSEAIGEQFFDALPGMKVEGWGSKLAGKIGESVSKHFGTKAGKATLKVLDSVGEGAEEVISNALSAIGNDIVHYVDNDYNYGMEEQTGNIFKDTKNAIFSNDSLTSFISASLTSAIVNGGNTFITEKQKKSIITAYANDNNMSYEEAKKMFNSIVDINTNSKIDENTNFNDKIDLEEEETKNLLNSIKNGDVDLKNYVNSITSQINEYEALKKQNKLTSEQEIELNELKNRLSAIQSQSTDTSTSIKEEVNLPTVQDIVNQEKSSQSGINLPVYNHQSNISNSDKAILPTVNDFSSSNTNMPTSDIKVDMAKISPEILNDIKGFKLGDPSIESYKGSYIKTMLNEVGIKVPAAMNYVSEVRPDMSFTTTKDLTRQQYASISNALQKLRSIDVTSVNNANYSMPIGNYQYVKSSNANINELRRTASMYLNNTARSNNTIKLLENIIKDRNYIIRFNPNITNEQGIPVNGLITKENGKTIIELNPNADNYVEFLVIHEITHDIATKEMKELILDYAKQDPEFEKSLESLKERYKTNDVSDEIVADVCGELFGNREFIQSVVEKKPNIFKKILNNIRKLAEKIKGTGANEYVSFVEKLKTMWEDAYYSNRSDLSKTMYHLSKNALNEVNDALNNPNTDINSMVKLRDFTPEQLVSVGVSDLPMLVRKGHLRENILTSSEAESKGYSTKGKHYHGLGIETYMNAIDSLDNPIAVYQYTDKGNYSKDNFIVLTEVKDSDNNNIIVPIEIHKRGQYNKVEIDINRIKTTYGKNNSNYFDDMVKNGSLVEIYNKKRSAKLPIQSGNFNTSTANNIPQSGNNVNSNTSSATKYSIPINKNNTQKLDNSSFSFDNKGRKLSKEQQEYFKDSKARDENGNLKVLYHGTPNDFTKFSYDKLGTNGTLLGKGFYLTDDINVAKAYASKGEKGKVMELYADIKKPLKWGEKSISKQQYKSFVESINEITNGTLFADYSGEYSEKGSTQYNSTLNDILMDYEYGGDDIDLVSGILNTTGMSWNKGYKILKDTTGYDGIIVTTDVYDSGEGNVYIPFQSNQIKNVDNTNPTSNEDIRYSQNTKEWNEYLKDNFPSAGTKTKMSDIKLPVREDISKNIELDYIPQDPTKESTYEEPEKLAEILKEKPTMGNNKDGWLKKLATIKFIDKGYYVDKLARKTKNKELSSKYDYSLSANGIANQIIGNGRFDDKGNKIGKGLYEIFEPIENSGLLDEFSNYIYHKHNVDRMSLQNRFNEANKAIFGDGMTSEMSEKKVSEYETKYPEFEAWANDIYEYNNANLEMLVKYGVLSKENVEYYNKKYPHYVPTIRENSKTKTQMDFLLGKKASVNSPIKKAKGGNGDIIPLKDAMALRTMQTVNSSLRNNFGLELLNTVETEQIRNKENVDNIIEDVNMEELLTKSDNSNSATLTVFENGEKITFDISDEIYEALKPSNIYTIKWLNKFNNIRRGLLTEYNPTFMITNPLKDIQDGSINSKHPETFAKNLIEAGKQIKNKGQYYQLYIANGGSYETYFNYNTGTNIAPSKIDKIAPLKKISEINEEIEMTPRLAEFISSIEAGDSIETAMYNSNEITTNFKRGGDITKTLDRNGVTFLNAGVQGTIKQIRNVQEARIEGTRGITKLAVRWTIAGLLPTLLMNMVWGDDDDYEELSDYVKNNYYIIGKYDNGEFIRIPKGRVVSVLQSFFQNVLNGIEGKEIDLKGFADLIENNLLPSDPNESSLIAPIKQAINNETWYGGDLVPTRLQNLPNAEQYDETTDSISIWLGKQLNISPYKINYVLDQYSGAIGDYILPYLTQEAESGNDSFTGKLIAPVKDKFTVDSTLKNQNISDFYSLSEKLTKKSNSSNATDEDILKNKYINSIKSEISKLYAEKREIQSSSSLKDSDKYNQSKELQKQINELSKTALNNYKNIEITDNYAIVGNKEYYKNSNDEWTKIDTESPKYKIANLITKYNNYLKYNDEIKNIKNQYENSNTRKNAVIKYVNSLDLTIPQKAMLIKMNYSSYNDYNNQIINYINKQSISLDEKKEILEELGFKVRNGKVYTK